MVRCKARVRSCVPTYLFSPSSHRSIVTIQYLTYLMTTGESGLDVYSRVTSFLATLYADFADDSIKVRSARASRHPCFAGMPWGGGCC